MSGINPDRLIGIAYAATRWHNGQWSRGYRLLSRIQWHPRSDDAYRLLPREEYTEARRWAAHYMLRARRERGLF